MNSKSGVKIILTVIAFVFISAGMSLLLYSPARQYFYTLEADRVISEYEKRMEGAKEDDEDDLEWLYRLIVQYNKELYESRQKNLIDPFSYEQVDFSLKQFGFDEDIIGYISIPRINVKLPVYLGASRENMKKGAVHLTQTSIPVGGINTNAVIAAHRGMSTAAMFREIQKLEPGDEITITNFRETLTYQVVEIKIIHPTDIDKILIQEGRDLTTLITCHPYRINYQRYVVYCERV